MQRHVYFALLFGFLLTLPRVVWAQAEPGALALQNLRDAAVQEAYGLDDLADVAVDHAYTDERLGITYVYLRQQVGQIPIDGAWATVGIVNGKVSSVSHRFIDGLADRLTSVVPAISDVDAIRAAASQVGKSYTAAAARAQPELGPQGQRVYDTPDFVRSPILTQDVYVLTKAGELRRAIEVTLDAKRSNLWAIAVDAKTGKTLRKRSHSVHCSFDHGYLHRGAHADVACEDAPKAAPAVTTASAADGATYRVFPWPGESPSHIDYTLVESPADSVASPFGWHDTNGADGPEFTITRGNNVNAYLDYFEEDSPAIPQPDGGADLVFDFPYAADAEPTQIPEATTVNLFYGNNQMHDFVYGYGFDEEAGNFQQNNYGNGGRAGDAVEAQGENGGLNNDTRTGPRISTDPDDPCCVNNAVFSTPSDGVRPRMQMYLWDVGAEGTVLSVGEPASLEGLTFGRIGTVGGGWGAGSSVDSTTNILAGVVEARDGIAASAVNDLCEPATNASELDGKVAIVERGSCFFSDKAFNVQEAGAVAVIICNFEEDVLSMGPGDLADEVEIPVLMLTRSGCAELRTLVASTPDLQLSFRTPDEKLVNYVTSSFDNGIVAHEYAHGISNRLTAGPSATGCLSNSDDFAEEQMGEGWSDFYALAATVEAEDDADTPRGIGTYAERQPTTGPGIRPNPYSRDMSINPATYEDVANSTTYSEPHGIGSIWASMIWDLYWNMVDVHGFDDDQIHGNKGNNKALLLITTAMKLQPCQPGFVDGRDAILAADLMLSAAPDGDYGDDNQRLIWETFARRGLGFAADQGDPRDRFDGVASFQIPPAIANRSFLTKTVTETIDPGERVDVSVLWANWKDDPIAQATITEELPAGASLIAGSTSLPFTQSGNTVTFEFSDLNEGDTTLIEYAYQAPSDATEVNWYEPIEGRRDGDDFINENLRPDPETGNPFFFELIDGVGFEDDWCFEVVASTVESIPYLEMTEELDIFVSGDFPVFSFFHRYEVSPVAEGAVLDIYDPASGQFVLLDPDLYMRNGPATEVDYQAFVLPFLTGFAGEVGSFQPDVNDWQRVLVDLSDYAGQNVRFRWRFGRANDQIATPGGFWQLDEFALLDAVMHNYPSTLRIDGVVDAEALAPNGGTFVENARVIPAVEATTDQGTLRAFPNPVDAVVNLSWTEALPAGTVQLYSATGALVREVVVATGEQQVVLSTETLSPGLYTVRSLRGGVEETIRLLKQ